MEGFTAKVAWFKSGAAEALETADATASEYRMALIVFLSSLYGQRH
jgi:hypothetical protein